MSNTAKGKKKSAFVSFADTLKTGIKKNNTPAIHNDTAETIQGSVPIYSVHEKANLIEPYEGCFTKSYSIENINYQTASEDEQDSILTKWRGFLNSLGSNTDMALTIFNRNINLDQFREEVMLKESGDGYDYLRRQMNNVILSRIMEGKNGITRDEFITLGVHTATVDKAVEVFKRLDRDIDTHLKSMQSSATPIKIEDRLEIFHDIYNIDNRGEFLIKTKVYDVNTGILKEVSSFDFDNIRSMGISVADVIAPSSFEKRNTYIKMGKQYVRVLRCTEFPSLLGDNFLSELTSRTFNMLTTLNVRPMSNSSTDNLINKQIYLIREEKTNEQRRNAKNNILDVNMVSPEIADREREVMELRDDIRGNDEHLFETVLTMAIFAPDLQLLDEYTDSIISDCKKYSVTCEVLSSLQEEGFDTTLPLCCNLIRNPRTLKSSSVAIFCPFSNLEIREKDGINYTMNAVSKNLLIYNRENKPNFNGFILGSSGCVDRDTEYFNGTEWKSIADYTEGEQVLQYNTELGTATIVTPIDYIKEECDMMYSFTGDGIDMMLSPEHRVIYYTDNGVVNELPAGNLFYKISHGYFHGNIKVDCNYERAGLKDTGTLIPIDNIKLSIVAPIDGLKYCFTVPTHTLVLRRNGNVFVTGNSGKSFSVKQEIVNVFLSKTADIMILDPEQEYIYLTTRLGGQVIPIMPGGKYHINPLDISQMDYEFDTSSSISGEVVDPILEKVSFIMKLFESMLSKTFGMESVQKTLIDECLRELYKPYMQNNRLYRCPAPEETPTLNDMMNWFSKAKEPEARELHYTLKRYAGQGTLNIFSEHTNVELHNRLVCFDISAVGEELKLMAMNIIQDAMWSRLVENRRIGKFTYIYIDECHLFFQADNDSAAEFLTALWKRARKYGGVPTGITQNTSDMVDHPLAKKLLSECNFIQVLNQSSEEAREHLKNILNLSESSLNFITNAPTGQGLFFTGSNTVPFYSRFPEDNDIYPILTSDMKKLAEYKEKERREKARIKQDEKKKKLA